MKSSPGKQSPISGGRESKQQPIRRQEGGKIRGTALVRPPERTWMDSSGLSSRLWSPMDSLHRVCTLKEGLQSLFQDITVRPKCGIYSSSTMEKRALDWSRHLNSSHKLVPSAIILTI